MRNRRRLICLYIAGGIAWTILTTILPTVPERAVAMLVTIAFTLAVAELIDP